MQPTLELLPGACWGRADKPREQEGELLKKHGRVVDIVIFGICLFIVLLLIEYRQELGLTLMWGISVPLMLVGIFFGYRAANLRVDDD